MSDAHFTRVSYNRYIKVRGLRLHYLDYGGDGEIVVALHGLLQNAHAFDGIAPLLVPHVRLIALDLPGRGDSAWAPPSRYVLTQYLLDLGQFLSELGALQYSLIGTSLGGWLARMYATAHPHRVIRLVLNDCAVAANLQAVYTIVHNMASHPPEFANMTEAIEWFLQRRDGLECLSNEALIAWVSHYLVPTHAGRLHFNCDPAVFQIAEIKASAGLNRPLVTNKIAWQQVTRLTMPVLILRGAKSSVVPRWAVARLVRILPAATCVEVSNVGHSPTLYERPAQQALEAFFGIK